MTKLVIAKEWDYDCSEIKVLKWLKALLIDSPLWKFVPVGNNLVFDLSFIAARMRMYFHVDLLMQLLNRPFIDLRHVLVMINGGRFRNYSRMIGKEEFGSNVPVWYQNGQYEKIVDYVEMDARAFVRTYSMLKRNLPTLAGLIA
ncbi:MAG: hypothetical protein HMLIMOIP_001025 [Candidatus Nitrosomirales archaeon]